MKLEEKVKEVLRHHRQLEKERISARVGMSHVNGCLLHQTSDRCWKLRACGAFEWGIHVMPANSLRTLKASNELCALEFTTYKCISTVLVRSW